MSNSATEMSILNALYEREQPSTRQAENHQPNEWDRRSPQPNGHKTQTSIHVSDQRSELRGNWHNQMPRRRPVTRLKIRTMSATTSRRWIKLPAMWKLKPRSHKIKITTNTVQSMFTPFRMCGAQMPRSVVGATMLSPAMASSRQ